MTFEFKTKPFAHQQAAFERFKDADCGALFWEMGLGKTKAIIDIIRYQYQKRGEGDILILCPKIVQREWVSQFAAHSSMVDLLQVVTGDRGKKLDALGDLHKTVFICNYDILRTPKKEIVGDSIYGQRVRTVKDRITDEIQKRHWTVVVADEMHRAKSHTSQRGKVLAGLGVNADMHLGATGTPAPRNELDLFNQFKFLDRGATFGTVFSEFKYKYFVDLNQGWRHKPQYFPDWRSDPAEVLRLAREKGGSLGRLFEALAAELEVKQLELQKKVGGIADRRKKKDCLDLKDPLYERVYVEAGPDQEQAYRDMAKEMVVEIDGGGVMSAQNVLTKSLRLQQISSGFMTTEDGDIVRFRENPKLAAVKELLEMLEGKKVIISAVFHADINILRDALASYNPAEIHGKTDNEAGKKKFIHDASCRVLLAHPRSLIGINGLTVASDMIYYSNNFNFEDRVQSRDRIHRPGQRNICTIYDIICTEMDNIILDTNLQNKQNLAERIMRECREVTA